MKILAMVISSLQVDLLWAHTQGKEHAEHSVRVASASQREASEGTDLMTLWSQACSLQNCKKINFGCLNQNKTKWKEWLLRLLRTKRTQKSPLCLATCRSPETFDKAGCYQNDEGESGSWATHSPQRPCGLSHEDRNGARSGRPCMAPPLNLSFKSHWQRLFSSLTFPRVCTVACPAPFLHPL